MPRNVVVIDHHDSFTYNLVHYLEELGARCTVVSSDLTSVRDVAERNPDGILLSPGPGGPSESAVTLELIRSFAGRCPILGVCLGHQAIGLGFGARVRRARAPVHGRSAPVHHGGTGLFRGIPSPFPAARYHSLALDGPSLPDILVATAWAEDGELMAIRHRSLPVEGVQFHPESILSEYGKVLLGNWLSTP